MDSLAAPFEIPVERVGCIASRLPGGPIEGRVEAVFRSTFYIKAGPRLLCLGGRDMGLGPLNLVTAAPSETDWKASGLHAHMRSIVSASKIRAGNRFAFPLSHASIWSPESLPKTLEPLRVKSGLAALHETAPDRIPVEGIGRFVIPGYVPARLQHTCHAAEWPMVQARNWLFLVMEAAGRPVSANLEWACKLLGLGPGLTPSGDDFLGGVMIALHSLGEFEVGRLLWEAIRRRAEGAGNIISLAHLQAASRGLGGAGIHRAVSAILDGDAESLRAAFPSIDRTGHSSGWDTMAGVVLTFESWLASR